jgi:hypothetical protein
MTRQEAVLQRLAARVEATSLLEGAVLIGSLAASGGDDLSDIDVIAVVIEGRFEEAWAARAELAGGEDLIGWDDVDPGRPLVAKRMWLTRDLVLVECLLAAPGHAHLAEPFKLVAGPAAVTERLPRRESIQRRELERFETGRREAGRTNEIEIADATLARVVRAHLRTGK